MSNFTGYTAGEKLTAAKLNTRLPTWVNLTGSGAAAIVDSYNVSSVVYNASGDYTINFDTDFDNNDFAVTAGAKALTFSMAVNLFALAVGSIRLQFNRTDSNALADVSPICVVALGDK